MQLDQALGQKPYKFLDEDAYEELIETQMETDMVFNIACNAVQALIYRGLSSFLGHFRVRPTLGFDICRFLFEVEVCLHRWYTLSIAIQ
jgi:hypothetical protein